ncbi:MAG: methyltransferase [Bryobacteraceae bacterium]
MNRPPTYWFPKRYADAVARLRVPCGFLLLITFAVLSRPTRASILNSIPICALGLFIRAWAAGHLAKNQDLATSGPYAYLRNPLYAGTLITAVGIMIAARNLALAAIFILVFTLVYLPVIELEEQHLREIFPDYAIYALSIHRLLPLQKWPGAQRRFSWSLYRRNEEYKALIGFLIALAWLIFRSWFSEKQSG